MAHESLGDPWGGGYTSGEIPGSLDGSFAYQTGIRSHKFNQAQPGSTKLNQVKTAGTSS
jgi:hypothetical protein